MRRSRLRPFVVVGIAIIATAMSVSGGLAHNRPDHSSKAPPAGSLVVAGNVAQTLRLSVSSAGPSPARCCSTCSREPLPGSIRRSRTTSCATSCRSRRDPTATGRSWPTASSTRASRTNDDDRAAAQAPQDAVDAAIESLLDGPSPVNMVHGALKVDGVASGVPRPSQAAMEAARTEILAALWGESL